MSETMKWKTKDGRFVSAVEMTDSHLRNAYRMLKRNGFISPSTLEVCLLASPPNGDMARDYYDQELDALFQTPVSPMLDVFEAEAERRKITL